VRERANETERQIVCVCVCERERERERMWAGTCPPESHYQPTPAGYVSGGHYQSTLDAVYVYVDAVKVDDAVYVYDAVYSR